MPTRSNVRHRPTTLLAEVRKADKDYDYLSRVQDPEYDEFSSGKTFKRQNKNFLPYAAADDS
jgi:hypothetical protein